MSENFTISKDKGYVNVTQFSFFTSSLTSQNYNKFLWDFGDGIRSREKNPTHIYVTPSSYNIILNAYYGASSYNIFTKSVEVNLLINNSIYFERIPPPAFAGHFNRYPFKVVITSPNTDNHYIDLYANYSRSYFPQEIENKWSFLRPQWRFLDLSGNQISTIQTKDTILYANSDGKISPSGFVAGVTGTAEFYFIDDTYNFDLVVNNQPYTSIIATLQTSATKSFNDPFNSRPNIPSFSNSLAQAIVPYMVLWRTPDYLRITENGVREHSNPRWRKSNTPIIINPSFKELEYPDYLVDGNGVTLLRPDQFFTEYLPIDNTNTIPICAGFYNLSSYIYPQPLEFKYADETNFKVAGYYKGNLNVANSAMNVALTALATFPIPNLSGNYYNPFLWIPNPAAGTLNVVQYIKNNFTDKLFVDNNIDNNQNTAIIQNYEIPIVNNANFFTDSMAFTGHHGINCVAVSPLPSYQAWAIDSDLNKLYKFATNGNVLCSIDLNSIYNARPFTSPAFCVLDGEQNLWVTLHDTTSTLKFDQNGRLLFVTSPLTIFSPSTSLFNSFRTNHLLNSNNFTTNGWSRFNSFIETDSILGPDDQTLASTIVEADTTTSHAIWGTAPIAPTNQLTGSIYVKAKERSGVQLILWDPSAPSNNISGIFNLTTGTVISTGNSGVGSVASAKIEQLKNGWFRCSISGKPNTSGTTTGLAIYLRTNLTGSSEYDGDGQSGIYIWGGQVETGTNATRYISTGASVSSYYDFEYLFDSLYYSLTADNISQFENFINPTGIDTDTQNNAWITYSNPFSSYVCKVSSNGILLSTFNYPIFSSPTEVVCDNQNNVWIALSNQTYRGLDYLEKRNSNGILLSTFGPFKKLNHLTIDDNQNPWFTYSYQYIGTINNGILLNYKTPTNGIYNKIPDWIDHQTYTAIPSTRNYVLWSQNFSNSYWVKNNVSVIDNSATSPIGDSSAFSMIEDNDNVLSTYGVYSSAFALTGIHTASIYAQANTRNYIQLDLKDKSSISYATAIFNLSTGLLSSIKGNAQIFDVGNNWYRCSITGSTTNNNPASNRFFINLHNGVSSNYIGVSGLQMIVSGLSSTRGIYFWGAQVELGNIATPYLSTLSVQTTRNETNIEIVGNVDESPLKGIAFDGKNNIFVLDSFASKVLVFDKNLQKFTDDFYINPKGFNFYPSDKNDITIRDPFLGIIQSRNNSTKIEYHPWCSSINATGDWTGWRWSNKYKNLSTTNKTISGISKFLDFYEKNPYEIFKINENFDLTEKMKEISFAPSLRDSEFLFEKFLKNIFGKENHEDLGVLTYEKIANFLNNRADIDDCDIDALYSLAASLDLDSDDFRLSYPFLIKRLMDLFSVNKSRLWGTKDKSAYNFEIGNEFGILNRGQQLTMNYIVTAGVPVLLKTKSLLKYNIIQTGLINSAVYYDLTVLSNFLNLGTDWNLNYEYFEYNPTSSNKQIEGIIDWNNPHTTIQYELSSFNEWAGNEKIVETSFAYQLYKGLGLLNE